MERLLRLDDLFKITCKNCGSENVYLIVDNCELYGPSINGECTQCGTKYNYRDFKLINDKRK